MDPRPAIVIVDDEPSQLAAMLYALVRRFGGDYRIVPHLSGNAALEGVARIRAEGGETALVIADQWMPEMNGVDLLARVRDLDPGAKRALLVAWGDKEAAATILEGCAFGKLENYVEELLRALPPLVRDERCRQAALLLESRGGRLRVDDLAVRLGLHVRSLERRFVEHLGLPSKRLTRLVRLRHVLARLHRGGYGTLADLAHACGLRRPGPYEPPQCRSRSTGRSSRSGSPGRSWSRSRAASTSPSSRTATRRGRGSSAFCPRARGDASRDQRRPLGRVTVATAGSTAARSPWASIALLEDRRELGGGDAVLRDPEVMIDDAGRDPDERPEGGTARRCSGEPALDCRGWFGR